MVIMKFVFNKDRLEEFGYTADELLEPMREYAAEKEIIESEPYLFVKDGEHAFGLIGYAIPKITKYNQEMLKCLDEWKWTVDGEEEDCLAAAKRWTSKWKKEGIM